MGVAEVIAELAAAGSPERQQRLARLGIPADHSFGVSVPEVRNIARRLGRNSHLAHKLWQTGVHEARLLAAQQIAWYFALIARHSADTRLHVNKAVEWALREVGQRDLVCKEQALQTAELLTASEHKTQQWIGRAAYRAIDAFVEVPGRRRLATQRR